MKAIYTLLLALGLILGGCAPAEKGPEVKNLIFLIGDGMGLAQYAMLEVEHDYAPNAFKEADRVALITTRSANNRVTDSAAAGTALATGHKTNNSMLGMLPDSTVVESMMERARDAGKATGLVVSCYLQHATPAAFYAHVPRRHLSEQITDQLVASQFDVMIGGGMRWLTEEHKATLEESGCELVQCIEEVEHSSGERLLALLADEYLPHAPERGDVIPRATKRALELLAQDPDGFMLMVEGSQIDGAGHANDPAYLLAEMEDFEQVVQIALEFTRTHPGTLLVVTADHETGGLTLPSGKSDFTLSESGIDYRFGTGSHSAVSVPVYLYGTGADSFKALMENTELAHRIEQLLGTRE